MYTELNQPYDVFIDKLGNIYIADTYNNRIREINTSGIISTIAGNGTQGFGGDGGPATASYLNSPHGVYVDNAQNIYISDVVNNAVRKIDAFGTISTIAGRGRAGFSGDGGPATAAELDNPWSVCTDSAGNIYIADEMNQRIRKINTSGIISTIAGTGVWGYNGDGGRADTSELSFPIFLYMDRSNLLIADYRNERIRKINSAGIISTIAGTGFGGFDGDGGMATATELYGPWAIGKDSLGNMYISDDQNYRIRKVDAAGIITTIAGNGKYGYTGDGGPATAAELSGTAGICLGKNNNIYFVDGNNNVIREIVTNPTAIENILNNNSELNLFPNPTNKFLYINTKRLQSGLATLSIRDIAGREVLSFVGDSNIPLQIDVSSLSSGIYFLSLTTKGTTVTQKFIKQ